MKHKETPKIFPNLLPYLSISLAATPIGLLTFKTNNPNIDSLELIYKVILISITCFISTICAIFEIKIYYEDSYQKTIAHAYRWSVREALRTQYPHGIVYILENILKELNKFNITNQPYKDHRTFQNSSSDYYGFPNQSNLRAIIVKAKYLCEEWSKLDQIQEIQCMESLWNQIREEDMWLDYNKIKLNKSLVNQDIYWYSYEDSDHKKISDQSRDTKDLRNSSINRSNNNIDESVW